MSNLAESIANLGKLTGRVLSGNECLYDYTLNIIVTIIPPETFNTSQLPQFLNNSSNINLPLATFEVNFKQTY